MSNRKVHGSAGAKVEKPEFPQVKPGWIWGRILRDKTAETQNLQNFNKAINYLRAKYGTQMPKWVDARLTQQLKEYQSNGRGINGKGGRLEKFDETKLEFLELIISKEIAETKDFIDSLKPKQIELLGKIESNWKKLPLSNIKYILSSCEDLINFGNKSSFAVKVGKAMVTLYRNNVESVLPKFVIELDGPNDVLFSREGIDMREKIANFLTKEMSQNGGDYKIMRDYFIGQQDDSWSEESLCLKCFYLNQRENPEADARDRYFLGNFKEDDSPRTLEKLRAIYNAKFPKSADKKRYAQTLILYQAFTIIALQKMEVTGRFANFLSVDTKSRVITTDRSMNRIPQKYGIADSTFLGIGSEHFMDPSQYNTVIGFEMSFSAVRAIYFLSQELSQDFNPEDKPTLGSEHEVVGDMSCGKMFPRRTKDGIGIKKADGSWGIEKLSEIDDN